MKDFVNFVREQGVVGLALGVLLGGAVSKVVSSFVKDIVSPILALGLHNLENLKAAYLQIGAVKIMWGSFLSETIDFIVIAIVVYVGMRILKIDKLDRKKIT